MIQQTKTINEVVKEGLVIAFNAIQKELLLIDAQIKEEASQKAQAIEQAKAQKLKEAEKEEKPKK
jgi:translation elongation factor EF-G